MDKPSLRHWPTVDGLRAAIGADLGRGRWHLVSQAQINTFAEATGDHHWIHVDPELAATGPFGTTVAHGYLTLSPIPSLVAGLVQWPVKTVGINYGLNRVRFPGPVPSGCRIRASARLLSVEATEDGAQICLEVIVEREGGDKPVCVAETITRYYF